MASPSEILASQIAERLVKEGLLSEAESKKLLPKLRTGKVKSEDWRLAIELSAPEKAAK